MRARAWRDMLDLIAAATGGPDCPRHGRLLPARGPQPALQARGRLIVDRAAAHLAATIAGELSVSPANVVAAASASVLTALRYSVLDQARRDSLAGRRTRSPPGLRPPRTRPSAWWTGTRPCLVPPQRPEAARDRLLGGLRRAWSQHEAIRDGIRLVQELADPLIAGGQAQDSTGELGGQLVP